MALVIVRDAFHIAQHCGQQGLGALQRLDLAFRYAALLGRSAHRPMAVTIGPGLQHGDQPCGHLLVIIGSRPARAGCIAQPRHPVGDVALTPVGHRLVLAPPPAGNRHITLPIGRPQDYLRPAHQAVCTRARSGQLFQLSAVRHNKNALKAFQASCAQEPSYLKEIRLMRSTPRASRSTSFRTLH